MMIVYTRGLQYYIAKLLHLLINYRNIFFPKINYCNIIFIKINYCNINFPKINYCNIYCNT